MKTAISVPDETYERATKKAKDLGMSRSEFFSHAAARYLRDLDDQLLTQEIDDALSGLDGADDSTLEAVDVGHQALDRIDDDW